MRRTKRIISLLLVAVMLIGILPIGSFATNGETESQTATESTAQVTESPLKIEVTTDKDKYGAIGIATFNVKITNTSSEIVNNVSAEAVFDKLSPVGSNGTKEIETLNAGESFSFSYKATVNANKVNLNIFQKVFLWIVRLFNGGKNAKDNGFDNGREYLEESNNVKFGDNSVDNTVRVWYGDINKNNTISFNKSNYTVTQIRQTITGKINNLNPAEISKILYSLYSYESNEEISNGTVVLDNGNWIIDDLLLRPNKNKLTLTLTTIDGLEYINSTDITFDEGYSYTPNEENIVYTNESKTAGYVNNILLLSFKKGVSEDKKNEIIESINGKIVGINNTIDLLQIEVPTTSLEELKQVCKDLEKLPEIYSAIYDIISKNTSRNSITVPNDPWKDVFEGSLGTTWNEIEPDGYNWWLEAIHAPSAWNYNDEFTPITIGIVDSGFDIDHEDLNINIINGHQNNKEDHGTHVAGIIGATANNETGITGITWNSQLLGYDAFPNYNITVSDAISGISACISRGAKVVNLSCGWYDSSQTLEHYQVFGKWAAEELARIIEETRRDDFIIVQAAGNDYGVDAFRTGMFASVNNNTELNIDSNITISDILNHIIIVGAVDTPAGSYKLTNFSNIGEQVSVVAPGKDIYSTVVMGGSDGNYKNMPGTSMSAPIVSGVVALVWSIEDNSFSASEVKDIVCNSSLYKVKGYYGHDTKEYNMVNASSAVIKALIKLGKFEDENPTGDDGVTNWDFIEPVTHLTQVPDGYTPIYTAEDLNNVRNDLTGNYILMNDIDLSDWGNWEPIGDGVSYIQIPISVNSKEEFHELREKYKYLYYESDSAYKYTSSYVPSYDIYYYCSEFYGIFDGNGYTIKNITINVESINNEYAYAGLFGKITYSYIKNISMTNVLITGTREHNGIQVGSIVGYNRDSSIIENCYMTGNIELFVLSAYAGGIVGQNSYKSLIKNCYNSGKITVSGGQSYVGGIVGSNDSVAQGIYNFTSIINCYNTGDITSNVNFLSANSSLSGGIAGYNGATTIENSYNTGKINASSSTTSATAGGIIGSAYNDSYAVINSYNRGDVIAIYTGTNYLLSSKAGGILGSNGTTYLYKVINNCYNTGNIKATSRDIELPAGAISGTIGTTINCYYLNNNNNILEDQYEGNANMRTESEMKQKESYTTFDFNEVWGIDPSINNGYPYLLALKDTYK